MGTLTFALVLVFALILPAVGQVAYPDGWVVCAKQQIIGVTGRGERIYGPLVVSGPMRYDAGAPLMPECRWFVDFGTAADHAARRKSGQWSP